MIRKRHFLNVTGLIATGIIVAGGCAKIASPTGGPEDFDPPVILKSQPANGSVKFSSKSFVVSFDEYVILDKINEKFMVSPPLTTKPDIKLRGKDLVVSWDEKLADSTTYTFNFQDAIRDNNRNNPISNYQYVFSTGPVLDSLSLTGNAFNASDLEVTADMLVTLYSNLSDTAPSKVQPSYISRPDNSGGFIFRNLKPGRYRLYALKDINMNRLHDLADEQFGLCDSVISVTPENNNVSALDTVKYKAPKSQDNVKPDLFTFGRYRIYTFVEDPKKQYLKFNERKSAAGITLGLALPLDTFRFDVSFHDVSPEAWYMESGRNRDTFRIWITDPAVYGRDILKADVTYPFTDSTGVIISRTDTITFRYQAAAASKTAARQPKRTFSTNLNGQVRPGIKGMFMSNTPLQLPDTSRIRLIQTVDSISKRIPAVFVKDTLDSRRVFMTAQFRPGASYSLTCLKGALSDIYGIQGDSSVYKFTVTPADNYGSIGLNISGYEGEIIIQLMGEKENVLRESKTVSPGKVKFELLDKGRYKVRVIYDTDGNGRWSTGNYSAKVQPEPVTYYPEYLDVKINWELDQDWDISRKYVKEVAIRSKPEVKR